MSELLLGCVFCDISHQFAFARGFHRSMRGQDCKRTHSAQGNAGYIYEAKRREIKEIETMRGARVCRGFDFSVKTFFE